MAVDGGASVALDLSPVDLDRYPAIVAHLREVGIDAAREPVPVAPAAHYLIGGVRTDLEGHTSVRRLFAVGECACTGLHGANRLASNSLSECFVFGSRAARAAASSGPDPGAAPDPPSWRFEPPTAETRRAVWELAGPIREASGLERLTADPYPLARAIATSALAREESRGAHRRSDRPERDPGLDGVHVILDHEGRTRLDRWRDRTPADALD